MEINWSKKDNARRERSVFCERQVWTFSAEVPNNDRTEKSPSEIVC